MKQDWTKEAIFYHIYPLGLCNAPQHKTVQEPVSHRLEALTPWLDHIQSLGANSIYLGPVFQSTSHGYDTEDYYQVDQRLGDNETLSRLADRIHERGMRLVLDAVFNHVGREFWAFKDILTHGERSPYCDWFQNLNFNSHSPLGDPFQYESWQGHYSLVKLNLSHADVRAHLFDATAMWMEKFGIDGLRLDAADCIDLSFLSALQEFTKSRRPDFWLMGEVVHGDYRRWVNHNTLASVTNYESYKGLFSSLNDANYHEIAYSLNRQFGAEGIYRDMNLYNFVDNHDVNRVASQLNSQTHLYPLYLLLFTMPGVPSIYYGSEWGIEGKKERGSDISLRPPLDLAALQEKSPHPNLARIIRRLSDIRKQLPALKWGDYQSVHVGDEQLAFIRTESGQTALVVLNSASRPITLEIPAPIQQGTMKDWLNSSEHFQVKDGRIQLHLPPTWGRILTPA
jgi:glycosidase